MLYQGVWNPNELDYRALAGQWHVVCLSTDVGDDQPKAVRLLGEELVLWRDDRASTHVHRSSSEPDESMRITGLVPGRIGHNLQGRYPLRRASAKPCFVSV